jgi:FimV-like protein
MLCSAAVAQFLPDLQASSPEEFDAYIDVVRAGDAKAIVEAARRFLRTWPSSELQLRVHELQFEAYRTLGDAAGSIATGERGITLAPDYLPLLSGTASVLANTAADAARLKRSQAYADKALSLLATAKAPRTITPAEWLEATGRLKAESLSALGVIAYKRGNIAEAVHQLEAANAARPSPEHQFRLAVLYREVGRAGQARALLENVMAHGEPALRSRARRLYETWK